MLRAAEALQHWCDLWGVSDLAPGISVEFSSRMTRSLGRCYPERRLIRIAQFVLEESNDLVQEVLCHEAAHLAAYHLHGRSIRPHGPEWKALVLKAGYSPSVKYKGVLLTRPPVQAPRKSLVNTVLEDLQRLLTKRVRSTAFKRRRP